MVRIYILALGLLYIGINMSFLKAQQIRFNEVMASNSTFFDEDGDTPDWFELYNYTNQTVSLEGWTVSDDRQMPDKWQFPAMNLEPDSYIAIWASSKDRQEIGFARTFVSQQDTFSYLVPATQVDEAWTTLGFDDSDWKKGLSSFGYGDGDDQTLLPQGTRSVFLRKKFHISNIDAIQEIILDIDYDDGFVAYINNKTVARANITGTRPRFDAGTPGDREAQMYQGGQPQRFTIQQPNPLLQEGENILCIQVHNISPNSSDLTAIPFFSVVSNTVINEGIPPPSILRLSDRRLHTNFKISSKKETLFLFDDEGMLVDSIFVDDLPPDVSLGFSSNTNSPKYYTTPTPGFANPTEGAEGINDTEIKFSHPGGVVNTLSLILSGISPDETIRYTLDATIPTNASPIYNSPISIDKHTVVRARVFQDEYIPSKVQTHTYLLNVSHDLPIVSLVTEPRNLFDRETGMYVRGDNANEDFPYFGSNFWKDWERPMHITLFEEDGTKGIDFDGGAKIFGGWSRGNAQRSFSIFARNQYGIDEIEYPLFPNLPYDKFQSFVLRNSGNDWLNTMMRDGVLTGLMKGANLEYQAFRPTVTYINGQYWGIYNIREKINEHFLASKHNADIEDIDILERNSVLIYGDDQEYKDLINYITFNNLSDEDNYNFVAQQIDIDNYATYQAAQIYFDNTDWPGNNIKFWKVKGGKWRWILFDTDFGFGIWDNSKHTNNTLAFALEANGPNWPNPPWSTLLFRKMIENTTFRNIFVNRFADELNSRFLPEKVLEHIDTLATAIEDEIPRHYSRWNGNTQNWANQISSMRRFANLRSGRVRNHIRTQFALKAFHTLNLKNAHPGDGYVKVNSLEIQQSEWEGDYFQGVPIKLTAIPEPGFTFSHWLGEYNSTEETLELDLQEKTGLTAHFRESTADDEQIIINEINYHSSDDFDTGDWIELHNLSPNYVNISGWELRDDKDDNSFILPPRSVIQGNGYLVVARESKKFRSFYPELENVVGDMDFGLSSNGDAVRLFDHKGEIRDEVMYQSTSPWPEAANGNGPTLELRNPIFDNTRPENWGTLHDFGSPGESNLDEEVTSNPSANNIDHLIAYPNPSQDRINITFSLRDSSVISAILYDSHGVKIHVLFERELEPGDKHLVGNLGFLSGGIYMLQLRDGNGFVQNIKWVKM